jgi:hypothetical protein
LFTVTRSSHWTSKGTASSLLADPSATLSPSAHFPGSPVIRPTLLQRFRAGARRASPVARHVLAIVPSLPPRRSEITASVRFRLSMLPLPYSCRLGLRSFSFSRPHPRSSSLRPDDSHVSHRDRPSIGFRNSVSLLSAIQATGPLTLAPAGLFPAEHASLRRTRNRTGGFPASGSRKGLTLSPTEDWRYGVAIGPSRIQNEDTLPENVCSPVAAHCVCRTATDAADGGHEDQPHCRLC